MSAENLTANTRLSLARTGVLFTQCDDDPGHISDYWRKAIVGLCDALDATPMDAAELLRQERHDHDTTRERLAQAIAEMEDMRQRIAGAEGAKAEAEDDLRVAVHLVTDAVPRMKTLNSAMSVGWLDRAQKLLED